MSAADQVSGQLCSFLSKLISTILSFFFIFACRTIASYNLQEQAVQKFETSLESPRKAGIKQGFLAGLTTGATAGTFQLIDIAIIQGCISSSETSVPVQNLLQGCSLSATHWLYGMELCKLLTTNMTVGRTIISALI